jgi:asparagine synthase (glutamine-hydrolysing)
MCGIFGALTEDGKISIKSLQDVSEVIKHRGPDDEGYFLTSWGNNSSQSYKGNLSQTGLKLMHISTADENVNIALLHRRLSIIDLSDLGHQPMNYIDRYWITLNGEIYNYIEIRVELLKRGYRFKSTSDTEVVLAAYAEWGKDCVHKFNGMWAFAIWDSNENSLFISRDRFGVKPLYYYSTGGVFVFCSEIKGIRCYLNGALSLDTRQLLRFLDRGEYMEGESESSLFEGIKQLMPGNNLEYKHNKLYVSKYYNLKIVPNKNKLQVNIEILRNLFSQSIKYRLRSDVEVGSCLSGGIDSSSIVSYTSSFYNTTLNTFSAIWPGEAIDESYYIDKVNQKCRCVSHSFKPDLANLLDTIDREIWHQEMPLSGSSLLAQWFVMENAKTANIKVLLDGQGADEILGGYPWFLNAYVNDLFLHGKWNELFVNYRDLRKKNISLFKAAKTFAYSVWINKMYKSYFPINPEFTALFKDTKHYIDPSRFGSLAQLQKHEIEKNVLLPLLHIEDRNSMAHSVESRLPFMDYKLVEFCINIPANQKIKGLNTKYILKEAMKDYLPSEVYNRKDKIGFATPLERNYFNVEKEHHDLAIDYIRKSEFWKMGLINNIFLNENISANHLFTLYTIARFIDMWF